MDFKTWMEMPLRNFNLVGKWDDKDKPAGPKKQKMGYFGDDVGILTNKNAQEKIKKKWGRVQQDFDLHFVRKPGVARQQFIGEVDQGRLQEMGIDIKIDPDAVTLVFTNNMGANRIPMNWWAMAHRFGHALRGQRAWEYFTNGFDKHMLQMLREVYNFKAQSEYGNLIYSNEKILREVAMMIGTMKSCRTRKLDRYFEFHYELLAQYMIEGQVRFNPPTKLIVGHSYGRPQYRSGDPRELELWAEHLVESVSDEANHDLDYLLNQMVGKIFVI